MVRATESALDSIPFISQLKPYPAIKKISIQYEGLGNSNFHTKLKNQDFENGDITRNNRIRLVGSQRIWHKKKVNLSLSGFYLKENFNTFVREDQNQSFNKRDFDLTSTSISINATILDSLFNRPLITNTSLVFSSNDFKSVKKLSGLISAGLILKYTRKEIISVGLAVIAAPHTSIPVFPTFSYWYKFDNSPWAMDLIFPLKFGFRNERFLNGWLTIGTELNASEYLFNQNNQLFDGNYQHNHSELLTGLSFEYPVSKLIIAGVKGGVRNSISSITKEKNSDANNKFISVKSGMSPFINFSISILPWSKKY